MANVQVCFDFSHVDEIYIFRKFLFQVLCIDDFSELEQQVEIIKKSVVKLNKYIKKEGLGSLRNQGLARFRLNDYVMSGQNGQEYKDRSIKWFVEASLELEQLCSYKNAKLFKVGGFGSIWFDVNLTGQVDGVSVTKKTRVALATDMIEYKQGEPIDIVLDATFDATF
jgi:hypothetical protein